MGCLTKHRQVIVRCCDLDIFINQPGLLENDGGKTLALQASGASLLLSGQQLGFHTFPSFVDSQCAVNVPSSLISISCCIGGIKPAARSFAFFCLAFSFSSSFFRRANSRFLSRFKSFLDNVGWSLGVEARVTGAILLSSMAQCWDNQAELSTAC